MNEPLNILVIEDDDTDFRLLERRLLHYGPPFAAHRVATAAALMDALQQGGWDLIITDYTLPDINIREKLQVIMAMLPDAPVIMVSGTIGEETAIDLLKDGIQDFINKDNLARLIPSVHRAMRDHQERNARRDAQQALEHSEVRYRKLYEELCRSRWQQDLFANASSDVMYLLDAEGHLSWWNRRVEETCTLPAADLPGASALRFIVEADRPAVQSAITAALRDGSAEVEARVLTVNGAIYHHFRGSRAENDGVVYIAGIGRDISERRAQEQALRLSETRLREAQAMAHLGSWELETATAQCYWSEEIYRMFGIPNTRPPGLDTLRDVLHPDDWPQLSCIVDTAMQHGEPAHSTFRILHGDGTPRWIDCRVDIVLDEAGQVARLVGVVQDVTEQRRYQDRLRQSATVFDSTAEGVFITDAQAHILDINPAFTEITGYRRDEVLGKTPGMWRSERHDQGFYDTMWREVATTGRWQGEIWNRRKDGSVFPEWLTISAVQDGDGRITNYVAVFADITSIKRSQEELEHLAHYDALTGLPNRLLLQARLKHAVAHAQRSRMHMAVIFMDLDRFKNINDSFGHPVGDELLREVAGRLVHCVRLDDTVARIGGDEFVLLLENISHPNSAAVVAEKVQVAFTEPFEIDGHAVHVTASMGICTYPRDGDDTATLLRNADAAMYRAKDEGRSTYRFYTEELTTNAFERVLLESSLRQALLANQFYLVYQPQVDMRDLRIVGIEALLRWRHPELGIVGPAKFIPVAEDSGLIRPIGEWVVRTACAQARRWLDDGFEFGHIAVNVAGPQLQRDGFVEVVRAALQEQALPPQRLELEVTENFIMHESAGSVSQLAGLRELGVGLAIDDFGTGYSSLSYLKALPIDKVKIDQSFVHDIPGDPNDMAISRAIIAMASSLNLAVIAEGVESPAQADFLLAQGCTQAQGYLYSRPLEASELVHWLRERPAPAAAMLR